MRFHFAFKKAEDKNINSCKDIFLIFLWIKRFCNNDSDLKTGSLYKYT